jgi:transposase
MEEDEQKLRVRLVGRNGRRRYDPASKDRLVAVGVAEAHDLEGRVTAAAEAATVALVRCTPPD